jgi:hypothetical protein
VSHTLVTAKFLEAKKQPFSEGVLLPPAAISLSSIAHGLRDFFCTGLTSLAADQSTYLGLGKMP